MDPNESDFELVEPNAETGFGKKGTDFSHELLVYQAYVTVIKSLAQEMTPGYWETKRDKLGNMLSYYVPDKRKTAVEAIITLKNCMIADIHATTYQTKIKELMEKADEEYKTQLDAQKNWYNTLRFTDPRKEEYKIYVDSGYFNDKGIFYQNYILNKLEVYRKIFEQLEMCLNARKYFKKNKVVSLAQPQEDDSK
jgi:hypothetical protein